MSALKTSSNVCGLRYKRDIMKAFVKERFYELDPEEDIVEAYTEYEREALQADIESFATDNKLEADFVSRILHQYFMDTKAITRECSSDTMQTKSAIFTGQEDLTNLIMLKCPILRLQLMREMLMAA